MAGFRSTGVALGVSEITVRALRDCTTHAQHGSSAVRPGMNAGEAFARGEAGEITTVIFHPRAELCPQGARLVFGERLTVEEDGETQELTSARSSAAWAFTSTFR